MFDFNSVCKPLSDKERKEIIGYCSDILQGVWSSAELTNVTINQCKGGIANRVYHCSIEEPLASQITNEPKDVIVRLHGSELLKSIGKPKLIGDATECIVFICMSLNNMGPKLLGVFNGGRIEEYIPNEKLTREAMKSMEIDEAAAVQLARIHSLEIPISKKPRILQMFLNISADEIEKYKNDPEVKAIELNEEQQKIMQEFAKVNNKAEVAWLEASLDKLNSRIVFSHNDAHSFNIIFRKDYKEMADRVIYIDYELSNYNYRGYDLSRYLILRNYHICEGPFDVKKHAFPSQEVKKKFLLSYLKEWKAIGQYDPSIDNLDKLTQEVELLSLLDDFLLYFWYVECAQEGFILFKEILEYASVRYKNYVANKQNYINKYH